MRQVDALDEDAGVLFLPSMAVASNAQDLDAIAALSAERVE